jgi:hypothetical protein
VTDFDDTLSRMREHVEPPAPLAIICGDDGKQIAFRGKCPKCGGDAWVPAAVTPAQMKALQDAGILPQSEAQRPTDAARPGADSEVERNGDAGEPCESDPQFNEGGDAGMKKT